MRFVSNEYIYGASGGNVGTGRWAVSYWIKGTGASQRYLNKNNGSNSGFDTYFQGAGKITFTYPGGSGALDSVGSFNDGVWHHVLETYDSGTTSVYIDGSFNNSGTPTIGGGGMSNGNNLNVGRSPSYGTTSFTGSLFDVRLYNDISISFANLSKILYEGRGADNFTDGMVTRCALEHGLDGTTVGTTTNIGSAGGTMAVSNTPTYEAIPFSGY